MGKLYDIRAKVGEYEKGGEKVSKYQTIGVILDGKNGSPLLKLDTLPVNWDGFGYLNEPKDFSDNVKPDDFPADNVPEDVDEKINLDNVEIPF